MVAICFYFQVHQPIMVRKYRVFDIGNNQDYFDEIKHKEQIQNLAENCYIPMNKQLLKLIKNNNNNFKISFSISGIAIEQMQKYAPKALESFVELAKTGCVEFLSETYYHSLSFLYSKDEFKSQIEMHTNIIKKHFNQEPKIFRNTELIYSNDLADFLEELGFKGILTEGGESILGFKSENHLYEPQNSKGNITLFTNNLNLSNDISNNFFDKYWDEYPLNSTKFSKWINNISDSSDIINLFLDYKTFNKHGIEKEEIFNFMKLFPEEILSNSKHSFITPTDALHKFEKKEKLDIPFLMSSSSNNKTLSTWTSNKMQKESIKEIYELESIIKSIGNKTLLEDWRKLTSSDNFYYMNTDTSDTGKLIYNNDINISPYDSYVYFMNSLNDLIIRTKMIQEKEKYQEKIMHNPKSDKNLSDIKTSVES